MLRSFRFANHRSFRDEQELSLLPHYEKNREITTVTGIFGANASGKTSVVDALQFMRSAVINSYRRWEPDEPVPRTPFRLDLGSITEPSRFEVTAEINGTLHDYGFSVDNDRIITEWLHTYPEKKKRVVFNREGESVKLGSTVHEYRSRAAVLQDLTRPNALLLATATQLNQPEVEPIYQWFRRYLRIHSPLPREPRGQINARMASLLRRRPELTSFIRAADVGITDVQIEEVEEPRDPDSTLIRAFEARHAEAERSYSEARRLGLSEQELDKRRDALALHTRRLYDLRRPFRTSRVFFTHGNSGLPLNPEDESDGTLAWIRLMASALDVLDGGGLLVVDEIDSSLHPKLTSHLVEAFQDSELNPDNAQLIFTSHDTSLLGPAFGANNLRRDEIWFVEKDGSGTTSLYPLSDFSPREEHNVERRYLSGAYGAVPRTDQFDIRKALLEARASRQEEEPGDVES